MNCNQFEQQLEIHIGRSRLSTLVEATEHAAQCQQCLIIWEEHLLLEESLSQWNIDVPEVDLTESILLKMNNNHVSSHTTTSQVKLSRVATHPQHVAPRGGSIILVVSTVVLMFAAGLFLLSPSTTPHHATTQTADTSVVKKVPDSSTLPKTNTPEIRSFVKDAGVAYYSLAQNAVDAFADASLFIPTSEGMQMPVILKDETMSQPLDDLMESIGNDVKPIQSDLRKAVEFLFTSVPG